MDLAPFLVRSGDASDTTVSAPKTKYRLVSIVEHIGFSKSCGHYIAYVRSCEKQKKAINEKFGDKNGDKNNQIGNKNEMIRGEKEKIENKNEVKEKNIFKKDRFLNNKAEQKPVEKDVWVICNDSKLSEVDFKEVKKAMPYLLFYERIK